MLGLPRGGITVAREIARALRCPPDILIVSKIGIPGSPEPAAGAVSETGTVVLNEDIVSIYGLKKEYPGDTASLEKDIGLEDAASCSNC